MINPTRPVGTVATPADSVRREIRPVPAPKGIPAVRQQAAGIGDRLMTQVRRGIEATGTRLFARAETAPSAPVEGAPTKSFTDVARHLFDQLDTSRNGFLSKEEMARAMGDPTFKGVEAAAVAVLTKFNNEIENLANDEWGRETIGITRADLAALDRLPADHELSKEITGLFNYHPYQVRVTDQRLFADGLASIHSGVISQGRAGDCYFLAPLAGLADTNPQAIQRMIQDNGDGTYTVRFPKAGPITVAAPTTAELGNYAKGGKNGLWVPVIEKAFAEYRNQRRLNVHASDYDAASGGSEAFGIRVLTGQNANTYAVRLTSSTGLVERIRNAQAEGRVMVGSISWHPGKSEHHGLPTKHVYTVQGYDPDKGTIRIRNPWGTDGPAGDGIHDLTVAEFRRSIDFISIQAR